MLPQYLQNLSKYSFITQSQTSQNQTRPTLDKLKQSVKSSQNKGNNSNNGNDEKIITLRTQDMLFNYFYIITHSPEDFKYYEPDFFKEKQSKLDYAAKFQENKILLKQFSFARPSHYYENMLANEIKIDLTTFVGLLIIEKKNALFVDCENKSWWKIEGSLCDTSAEFTETAWIIYKNMHTYNTFGSIEPPNPKKSHTYMTSYVHYNHVTRNYISKF